LDAGIECFLSETVTSTVWEKFVFISSIASLTSYLDLNIGSILSNDDHKQMLLTLIKELRSIANAKGIKLPEDIIEKTFSI